MPLAEYWYNNCQHSAIGRSPFEALYGYSPHHFGISEVDAIHHKKLADWLKERQVMTSLIKQHLSRAKLRMNKQANKLRIERSFQVGELVFLKLLAYVQTSLTARSNHKLSFKYFGPYKIMAKVGQVTYKLDLPASSSIHPVFHVSQLKKAVSGDIEVSFELPTNTDSPRFHEVILQKRVVTRGVTPISQVLI
jgi:hypothetical protein